MNSHSKWIGYGFGLLVYAAFATSSPAQLQNASFEYGDSNASYWVFFNNVIPNVQRDFGNSRTGTEDLKVFGGFNADPNYSGAYQDVLATAGDTWKATVFVKSLSSDPMGTNNIATLKIEFHDATNGFLAAQEVDVNQNNLTLNVYTQLVLTATAPPNTMYARYALVFKNVAFNSGSVYFDDAEFASTQLENPGFEFGDTNALNWVFFNNVIPNVLRNSGNSHTGTQDLKMFGGFNADPNYSGAYQDVLATAGQAWMATAWVQSLSSDPIGTNNAATLKIEFEDTTNGLLAAQEVDVNQNNLTLNVYTQLVLTATAPPNTMLSRYTLLFKNVAYSSGSVYFDDAAFQPLGTDPFAVWQNQYFTSGELTNPAFSGPGADPFGKGMSNTNQFLAGFNPTNAAAYVHIISIAATNGGTNVFVSYLGASGDSSRMPPLGSRTNVLEFTVGTANGSYNSNNFASTGVTNVLMGGVGLGTLTNMVDLGGATNKPSRYYRVRVLVP